MFYDDPYDIDDQIACEQRGIIFTCDTVAQLVLTATCILENKASASKIHVIEVDTLFIELLASEDSESTKQVFYRSADLRISEKEDFTFSYIVKAVTSIMRIAYKKGIKINVWASTLCTSGCPWRHVNNALGRKTRDEKLTNTLIQHATRLCKLARVFGGHYTWEWPERCELWQDRRVRSLASASGHFALISALRR